MSNSDRSLPGIALIEAQDFDGAEALMTDDFTFEGPVPEAVDRDGFLGLQRAMATAFPDGTFQARDFTEQGDTVNATVSVGGAQTGTLSLPFLGLPDVALTGRSVRNPDEALGMTMRGGRNGRCRSRDADPRRRRDRDPHRLRGLAALTRRRGLSPPARSE